MNEVYQVLKQNLDTAKLVHSAMFLELITHTDNKLLDCIYVAFWNRTCMVYLLEADIKRNFWVVCLIFEVSTYT